MGEKLFVNYFTTHFTNFHTPENVRFGQDYSPDARQLLNYLLSQASIAEYQVRWRLRTNSVAIWDNRCTQHYAVQDFWPAAQPGTGRHRRRSTRLSWLDEGFAIARNPPVAQRAVRSHQDPGCCESVTYPGKSAVSATKVLILLFRAPPSA